jgi:hypothetical protein
MTLTASLLVALAVSTGATESAATSPAVAPAPVRIEAPPAMVPAPQLLAPRALAKPAVEAWMIDTPERRPAALPALYASLGALQALDVYSTRKAIGAGAFEANPLMRKAAGNSGTMLAVKAASTAAAIYFTERAWKKNKKGAVILMAAINGTMAAIVARNVRNARQ